MKFHPLLCVFNLISFSSCTKSYNWTEASLSNNIEELFSGKFKFIDGQIPFYEEELSDTTPKNGSQYDFIIIGAGSAGATVASRLSEIENITVLLIEAGVEEYPVMNIPGIVGDLFSEDQITWSYFTESSNDACLGYIESKCLWRTGKVMGGSSAMNFMLATRGNRKDYDKWANMTNDDSWSYKKMLKYLKKLENFDVKGVEIDSEFHNRNGHITNSPYHTEFGKAFIDAGTEMGYPELDYNGPKQIGFFNFHSTIYNGERWSCNRAYFHPANRRKNLFLTRNSHVNKIMINKRTKTAYGVNFSKFFTIFKVHARKEVISCASAINSPQILMLSGVGPAHHLRDLNINVIKDSQVGENLHDNIGYTGLTFETNGTYTPSYDYFKS